MPHPLYVVCRTCDRAYVARYIPNRSRTNAPTRFLGFRANEAERAHLYDLAKQAGMSASDYLRGLVPGLAAVTAASSLSQPTAEPTPTE